MKTVKFNSEVLNHGINNLEGVQPDSVYGCDLHNRLYNEDYFIIGYHPAEEFLKNCEDGIFGAIERIRDYEQSNFGEVNTDFSSSEKVANMYSYIIGEEILQESATLQDKWDVLLSEEDLKAIINELRELE